MKYTKARVFISSRNTYDVGGENLSAIREALKTEIETKFPFLEVRINEGWTAKPTSPREASVDGARAANLFLGILVADSGFTDKNGLSATHEEFDAASEHARQKMLVFAEGKMKDSKVFGKLPEAYRALYAGWTSFRKGKAIRFFDTGDELKAEVLDAVEAHCARTLVFWGQRARSRSKTTEDSIWELMTFTERHGIMVEAFETHAKADHGLALADGLAVRALRAVKGGYERRPSTDPRHPDRLPRSLFLC